MEHMPPSTVPIPTAVAAHVAKFMVSDDESNVSVSHSRIERPAFSAAGASTSSGTGWCDETFGMTLSPDQFVSPDEIGNQPPCLVDELDDED